MNNVNRDYLLGIMAMEEADYANRIDVKKNYISLNFSEYGDYQDYVLSYISPRLDSLMITDENQSFDVGYCIIELNPSKFYVNYTFKNGLKNMQNFYTEWQPTFGIDEYKSEPRELKPGEKPNLEIQPDSLHKKLYVRLDNILKKIIKPNMTQEQKLKAIHDYVVKNMTYLLRRAPINGESALNAINNKEGSCGNYTSLFYYLCKRAGITVKNILSLDGEHAWNAIYLNKQWLHVDTTWDDPGNKLVYKYYLKSSKDMAKTHRWEGFGYSK